MDDNSQSNLAKNFVYELNLFFENKKVVNNNKELKKNTTDKKTWVNLNNCI